MAKIVVAGKANCPYYARSELLGDKLSKNLPDFKLHKIVIHPDEWEKWLKDTCNDRGWIHKKSPLVWRELIDRGGKGVLIGGANEFQEYAHGYYGFQSELISEDMQMISKENLQCKIEIDKEEKERKALSHPLRVCITNASSPVAYSLIPRIAVGDVFGKNTEISLTLFDNKNELEGLQGVAMEAEDLAEGLLRETVVTSDIKKAFRDCGAIILMDELPQKEGESKSDWVKRSVKHFTAYAKVINDVALRNTKVILTGKGPVNMNVYMMIKNAPNIPRQNFVGHVRLLENHVKGIIAEKLKVNSAGVVDLIVWGNASGEHYVDINRCRVHGYDGAIWGPPSFSLPAPEMIWDKNWLEKEFPELIKQREQKIEELLTHCSSMSQASAVATMLGHWWNGTPTGQMFSLAVCSEGWYGVPEGMVYSFPITMNPKGYWNVVQDIDLSEEMKEKIQETVKDLTSEYEIIYPPPKAPTPAAEAKVSVTFMEPSKDEEQTENKPDETQKSEKTEGEGQEITNEGDEPKLETIVEEKSGDSAASAAAESS